MMKLTIPKPCEETIGNMIPNRNGSTSYPTEVRTLDFNEREAEILFQNDNKFTGEVVIVSDNYIDKVSNNPSIKPPEKFSEEPSSTKRSPLKMERGILRRYFNGC